MDKCTLTLGLTSVAPEWFLTLGAKCNVDDKVDRHDTWNILLHYPIFEARLQFLVVKGWPCRNDKTSILYLFVQH